MEFKSFLDIPATASAADNFTTLFARKSALLEGAYTAEFLKTMTDKGLYELYAIAVFEETLTGIEFLRISKQPLEVIIKQLGRRGIKPVDVRMKDISKRAQRLAFVVRHGSDAQDRQIERAA